MVSMFVKQYVCQGNLPQFCGMKNNKTVVEATPKKSPSIHLIMALTLSHLRQDCLGFPPTTGGLKYQLGIDCTAGVPIDFLNKSSLKLVASLNPRKLT